MRIPPELAVLLRQNEVLAEHTSFQTGGSANWYIKPPKENFLYITQAALSFARENGLDVFILGGGANLCVSDNGMRALVLDTGCFSGCRVENGTVRALCGTPSSEVARFCQQHALGGLEFLAGLPGSIGGALVMNARCFERSISDVLAAARYLDNGLEGTLACDDGAWGYKKSPFARGGSHGGALVLEAVLNVYPSDAAAVAAQCDSYLRQREEKGHFRFPSAGSVFKNDRRLGRPSGAIIEELGLRGRRVGGAQIAPWHGNFIINTGGATSADIRALVELVKSEARRKLGIELEEEILFPGEW
ncbi:MAG: UDP-N-acetylmuramate dehydrogenase [Spirochaetaceae bacterium]|jgi:UDP-N-acetylmuramate dehydrogenase|nr:UDP-N-acetylmuramate dehydrogenase [Spirochaetaceae bacterium]